MGNKSASSFVFVTNRIGAVGCIIFLIVCTFIECTPPYGREGRRRFHDRNHCHENSQIGRRQEHNVQNDDNGYNHPPVQGDSTLIEIYPEGVKLTQDPTTRDGDLTLKVYPPADDEGDAGVPPSEIVSPCPKGSGIYKPTGKCYRFTLANQEYSSVPDPSKTPCGPFMDYYKDPLDPNYGDCDCREGHIQGALRPTVYWAEQNRCYWLFDQGPCRRGQWLILNDYQVPTCAKRSCNENSPEDWSPDPKETSKKNFYFRHRGKCYKTGTQAFCDAETDRVGYMITNGTGLTLQCNVAQIRVILYGVKDLPCKPGHKKAINGQCSRVVEFD